MTVAKVFPLSGDQKLISQSVEPCDVPIDHSPLDVLKLRFRLSLFSMQVAYIADDRTSPHPTRVDYRSPDLPCFPQTVIGAVVLEAYVKGYGSTHDRQRKPRDLHPLKVKRVIEDSHEYGP